MTGMRMIEQWIAVTERRPAVSALRVAGYRVPSST
jgi:hypothetical protein